MNITILSFTVNVLFLAGGVVATLLITRYYYHRTVDTELTPYVLSRIDVFARIDESIKQELVFNFRDVSINDLQQIQFLIANTGRKAIKDLKSPLELKIPDDCKLIDAAIVHVHPKGRDIALSIKDDRSSVKIDFALLNRDEFFILKLLIDGSPPNSDYDFSITAEDLPPTISPRRLSSSQIETSSRSRGRFDDFDVGPFLSGLLALAFAVLVGLLAFSHPLRFSDLTFASIGSFWDSFSITYIAISAGYLTCLFLMLIGIALIAIAFDSFQLTRKRTFRLPAEFYAFGSYGPSLIAEGSRRMEDIDEYLNK